MAGLFNLSGLYATHNRAGEITLSQDPKDPFTYHILIQTFTWTMSAADRNELEVQWGDGSTSIAPRTQKVTLPHQYYWNQYKTSHTFPGPGTYTIVVQDPNRNFGVINIPNSVNVIFSVKTTIVINTGIGHNNTPVLLNPPIDRAAIGQVFVHNPAAYDPDGDSISYKLTVCTEENGEPIEDYTLPLASDSLYIDEITGDLIWNTPVDTGIYNIAIEIEEWRYGVKIGSIARDMQINVYSTDNHPPEIMPLRDFCVEAGDLLEYDIRTTDPDGNNVSMFATGGPFLFDDSPATFDTLLTGPGFNVSRFSWPTTCAHVRYQPYNVIVKAEDDHPLLQLVDISNFHIKVIGPAPENPRTTPTANSILLEWDASPCPNVTSYEIYRREGSLGYEPDSCTTGIPSELDYELIGIIEGRDSTQFPDDNNGEGLVQGIEYCYMVVAIFEDGTPGYPSVEVCGVLIPGNPAILQASVTDLDEQGSILLSWARPRELDTIPAPGPYEYIIYRSDLDPMGNQLNEIHRFTTTDLDDTTYVDAPVNTIDFPYSYKVELYNDEPGNRFLIGRQEVVSSTWLEIDETDNANIVRVRKNTPWVNNEYIIYRKGPGDQDYDSIGVSDESSFVDDGLKNGVEYCYRVKTIGWRSVDNIQYNSINLTHFACGMPLDTIPPCPPELTVESFCDSSYNFLQWTNPNNSCADDVMKYHIYYSQTLDGELVLIDSNRAATDTVYFHFPEGSLAGCYAVTAVDSFNNESDISERICVDDCVDYILPNVFTPNGDGLNDIFRPSNYAFVEKVDMKIYNRWGILVFQTEDPDINWDGKRMNTDQLVSPGVYYYVCDVYENRLTGLEVRNLSGFIYVFTEQDAVNPVEK
jgi:gliding motility-associated-like protein